MSLKRIYTWLLAGLMVVCATSYSRADEAELLGEFDEPFGFSDPYPYRGYQRPNTGYFFNFDQLWWSYSRPETVEIGQENFHPNVFDGGGSFHYAENSMDTSWLGQDMTTGQRYEFGHQGHHWGWLVSGFSLRSQTQQQAAGDVEVVFNDKYNYIPGNGAIGYLDAFVRFLPAPNGLEYPTADQDMNFEAFTIKYGNFEFPDEIKWGRYWDGNADGVIDPTNAQDVLNPAQWDLGDLVRMGVTFNEVQVDHKQSMWSTEFMPKYRFDMTHGGSTWEAMLGVRYINFKDRFRFQGWGGVLDDAVWDTNAINNLVGPQAGLRWYKQKHRLSFDVQTRFMAAWNFQSIRQFTRLAAHAPDYLDSPLNPVNDTRLNNLASFPIVETLPRTYTHGKSTTVFSPVGELRVNVGYNIWNSVTLRVGWTGLVVGSIARSPSLVKYDMPGMGIKSGDNKQTVFVQGLNWGVEVNY